MEFPSRSKRELYKTRVHFKEIEILRNNFRSQLKLHYIIGERIETKNDLLQRNVDKFYELNFRIMQNVKGKLKSLSEV
jgi:radical SAM superfamily enzyme